MSRKLATPQCNTGHIRENIALEAHKAIGNYLSLRGITVSVPKVAVCHVTLKQMASIVNKSKRTLERLRDNGNLPAPAVKGGKGKADEWLWSVVRPILNREYGRQLPEVYPSDRFIRS